MSGAPSLTGYKALVWQPHEGRLHVRVPYMLGRRSWFKSLRIRAEWDGKSWLVNRAKFATVLDVLLDDYGTVMVIRDGYRRTICDTRCREALGPECVCSCAGEHHGEGTVGKRAVVIGETTIIEWGGEIRSYVEHTRSRTLRAAV